MDTTIILRQPEAPRQVVLSDAVAAGESPTWTETVAIIRAIATHLEQSATPLDVPSLSEVAVLPTGAVQVLGGRAYRTGPVSGLGDLMSQLLERGGGPPPVVEIQRQAQSDPPVFPSVAALHAALEYFARPDPHGVLADYYNRASIAIEVATKDKALEALKEKTKAATESEAERRDERPKKRSRRIYWVAAIVIIPVTAALIAVLYGWQTAPLADGPAGAAIEAISSTGKAISATSKQVADAAANALAGLVGGSLTSNASPPAPAPAPAPAPVRPQRKAASAPTVDKPATPPPAREAAQSAPPQVTPALPSSVEAAPNIDLSAADIVYSAKDQDVIAPILVYPQLPTRRLEPSTSGQPGDLDLLVLEDGTVAEARLIPASNRFQDRMMVSAAKAWRFRPAQRNGLPVRYRIRIPITW